MKRLIFTLTLLFTMSFAFAQKKKDDLITVSSAATAVSVFHNMYQHLIQNGYEVTNKDKESGYLTAKKPVLGSGQTIMSVNVLVRQTDSTRAVISGNYTSTGAGLNSGPISMVGVAKSTNMIMWNNLVKVAKSQPDGKIKYSKKY